MKGNIVGRGRTALIYAWDDGQVLKLYEPGTSVAKVEHEIDLGQRIHARGIPSPIVEGFIEVDGQPGIIFERVNGPTMLEYSAAKPWRIFGTARRFAELQAEMHASLVPDLPDLNKKIKARLAAITVLTPETKAQLSALLDSYPASNAVCHGDFHPDNLIMSPRGPIIIDWLDVTGGFSLYDVARTSYLLSKAALPPGASPAQQLFIRLFRKIFHWLYLRRYRQLRPFTAQELKGWYRLVAAARLSEGIAEEEAQLLAIVTG
jgi:Ser/Thr protein kinase RdoA (MazF antagonist)